MVANDADQATKILTRCEASDAVVIVREHAERLFALRDAPGSDLAEHVPAVRQAAQEMLIGLSACDAEAENDLLMEQRALAGRFRDALRGLPLLQETD